MIKHISNFSDFGRDLIFRFQFEYFAAAFLEKHACFYIFFFRDK